MRLHTAANARTDTTSQNYVAVVSKKFLLQACCITSWQGLCCALPPVPSETPRMHAACRRHVMLSYGHDFGSLQLLHCGKQVTWRWRDALSHVWPQVLLGYVHVRVPGLHAYDERPLQRLLRIGLAESLLIHTIGRIYGLVRNEACQEINTVHHGVVRQRACQLDHVLHL